MNTVAAWVWKDLRALRWPLLIMGVWYGVQTANLTVDPGRGTWLTMIWTQPTAELAMIGLGGWIVLVDPPARLGAFWQLRPIPFRSLVAAKLIVLTFAVLLITGLNGLVLRVGGLEGADLLLGMVESALVLTLAGGFGFILASLVRRPRDFFLAAGATMVLSSFLTFFSSRWLGTPSFAVPSVLATRTLLTCLILVLGAIAVLAVQLRWRSRRRAAWVVAAVVLSVFTVRWSTVDLFAKALPSNVADVALRLVEPRWVIDPETGLPALETGLTIEKRPAGVVYRVQQIDAVVRNAGTLTETLTWRGDASVGCETPNLEAIHESGRPVRDVSFRCAESLSRFRLPVATHGALPSVTPGAVPRGTTVTWNVRAEAMRLEAMPGTLRSPGGELSLSRRGLEIKVSGVGALFDDDVTALMLRGETLASKQRRVPSPMLYSVPTGRVAGLIDDVGGSLGASWSMVRRPASRSRAWLVSQFRILSDTVPAAADIDLAPALPQGMTEEMAQEMSQALADAMTRRMNTEEPVPVRDFEVLGFRWQHLGFTRWQVTGSVRAMTDPASTPRMKGDQS